MAGAFVQTLAELNDTANNTHDEKTVTLSTSPSAGSIIIVQQYVLLGGDLGTPTVRDDDDTDGSEWNLAWDATTEYPGGQISWKVASGSETELYVDHGTDPGRMSICVYEYSGLDTTTGTIGYEPNSGSFRTTVSASSTPAAQPGLAIALLWGKDTDWDHTTYTVSIDDSYTIDNQYFSPTNPYDIEFGIASKAFTTLDAQAPTWSTTDSSGDLAAAWLICFTDSASGPVTVTRSLTDDAEVTDALSKSILRLIERALTDDTEIFDALSTAIAAGQVITERSLVDSTAVYDALTSWVRIITERSLSDSAEVTDALSSLVQISGKLLSRSLGDNTAVFDPNTPAMERRYVRIIEDGEILLTDDIVKFHRHLKHLVDSVNVSDDVLRTYSLRRFMEEYVDTSDTVTSLTSIIVVRLLADSVGVTSQLLRGLLAIRALTDEAEVFDALQKSIVAGGIAIITRSLVDAVAVADARKRVAAYFRLFEDDSAVADALATAAAKLVQRTLADSTLTTDQLARVLTLVRGLTEEQLLTADALTALTVSGAIDRSLADSVLVDDAIGLMRRLVRRAEEETDTYDELNVTLHLLFQAQLLILTAIADDGIEVDIVSVEYGPWIRDGIDGVTEDSIEVDMV